MLCWSCGKEIADDAVRCRHCEASVVEVPGDNEMEIAREFLENMDKDTMSQLFQVLESSKSGEEFVNRIMVGDCPECGSGKTGNCEHDPDVDDATIGRCFDCGHLWCTLCDSPYDSEVGECPDCIGLGDEFDDDDVIPDLERYHLLAAEIFGLSFSSYNEQLELGDPRFEEEMPEAARLLEQAVLEEWSLARVASELNPEEPLDEDEAAVYMELARDGLEVIDAEDPSESFRVGVRQSIYRAIEEGLEGDDAVEDLVTQICYRAADLGVLLLMEGEILSHYSEQLRHDGSDVDDLFDMGELDHGLGEEEDEDDLGAE